MANTESAKKRNRQTIKRTEINKSRMNKVRTFIRKVEDFIKEGNKTEAEKAFVNAQSIVAKTAQKGTLHQNTANRKISRLFAKVKSL